MVFTQNQPKDGDCILHCAHAAKSGPGHFFKIPEPIHFRRPDGTEGNSEWIMFCEKCYKLSEGNGKFAELIAGDSTWMGDEPAIKFNPIRPEQQIDESMN